MWAFFIKSFLHHGNQFWAILEKQLLQPFQNSFVRCLLDVGSKTPFVRKSKNPVTVAVTGLGMAYLPILDVGCFRLFWHVHQAA
jgi:hypothetical protein